MKIKSQNILHLHVDNKTDLDFLINELSQKHLNTGKNKAK